MIKEKAYAKINLALEVMNLVDGYHKVNNIMIPIDLYDELSFEKNDSIEIVDDPFKGNNIIEKAAKLFFEYNSINSGVKINLKKNIPYEAGLAGGSSDAAATLKGLNKLYDTNLSNDELINLAKQLGSDVPFFIDEKAAICTNRGEIINPLISNISNIDLLLIKPNTGLSTKLVYQNYKYENISKETKLNNVILALKNNDKELLKNNIFNDLGNVALRLNKDMENIYVRLSLLNYDVKVSGSGPTMYILDIKEDDYSYIKSIFDDSVTIIKTKLK